MGKGDFFDGVEDRRGKTAQGNPAEALYPFTLYDNQTGAMLQTPQKYPRAGSQDSPSPAAEAAEDSSTTIWLSPEQPDGLGRGNWIQMDPDKGWFALLRLYSWLASSFDKSWPRPRSNRSVM